MILRLNKSVRSYYAAPHTFTKQDPEQKVSAKLGRHLLKTGYFKEIEESDDGIDDAEEGEEEEIDAEVEASEQKKLYDESKEEAKKKSTKKDK